MTEQGDWGVAPTVVSALTTMGWTREAAVTAGGLQPARRGTSLVLVRPPSPAWVGPALAGVLEGAAERGGRTLCLAAPAMVPVLGALVARLAHATGLRHETALGPARAARRLRADQVDVLVCSPATALTLQGRSSLAPERVTALVLAWPDGWDADEALTLLLSDLPRDAQRIIFTAAPDQVDVLVERHARRAAILPEAPVPADAQAPTALRTVPTTWSGRAATIAALLEATDPEGAVVWTADASEHAALDAALGGALPLVTRTPPEAAQVICHDLPDLATLAAMGPATTVTLVVPPGTEAYVARIAPERRPIHLPSTTSALLERDAGRRATITGAIDAPTLDAALYAIAPLFERHEPQRVAAALYTLWQAALVPAAAPIREAAPVRSATQVGAGAAMAKLWVGVGKKDEATPGDLVAVLVKEAGLDRTLIGRIELRDTFTLVEVPASEADRLATSLTGITIRRRKLIARVDRGIPARGGSR